MNYWVHYNMSLHQYKTVPKNLFMSLNVIDLMRLLTFLHSIICIDLNKTHSPWFWIWVYWSASQTLSLAHWRSLPVQALVSSEWSLTGPSRPQTWVHIYSVYFVYRVIIKITKAEKKQVGIHGQGMRTGRCLNATIQVTPVEAVPWIGCGPYGFFDTQHLD